MLELALERSRAQPDAESGRNLRFVQADIRNFDAGGQFDVVTALFHVISYMETNEDLESAMANIRAHLVSGGIFIFDCWYGPGVLTDPPVQRVKTVESDGLKLMRVATPRLRSEENLVDVRYDLLAIQTATGRCEEITETHRMRYLFRPELEGLLKRQNLRLLTFTEWLSHGAPHTRSWNAVAVARAV